MALSWGYVAKGRSFFCISFVTLPGAAVITPRENDQIISVLCEFRVTIDKAIADCEARENNVHTLNRRRKADVISA
jgi:hypothetical protein